MILTEDRLNEIISESIQRQLSEMFDSKVLNEGEKTKTKKKKEKLGSFALKKKRVISYLKNDSVNVASYAYELWPDKKKDSARSLFYKCLDGVKNDSNIPYNFSDDEINSLYSMISDHSF